MPNHYDFFNPWQNQTGDDAEDSPTGYNVSMPTFGDPVNQNFNNFSGGDFSGIDLGLDFSGNWDFSNQLLGALAGQSDFSGIDLGDWNMASNIDISGIDYTAGALGMTNTEILNAVTASSDVTRTSGVQSIAASQTDLGISSGAVGSRQELGRMLESYKGRTSLIQAPHRQKLMYTIDST